MNLICRDLRKKYGHRLVVDGVSISVAQGEIVGLLGPNGAGKTTTFYMAVGLVTPTSGSVLLDNMDITDYPMYMRARSGIGYLSQEPSIFRRLTVRNNLLAVLEMMPLSKVERELKADSLLDELGLQKLKDQQAYTLSGGEKRRCEIARALASNPKFLLLDEPFVGIDPITVSDIQGIIGRLRKDKGLGILITDHNVRETLEIIDKAYIIYSGNILLEGDAQQLIDNPQARQVYLGENFKM